jgi:hypothetical protein
VGGSGLGVPEFDVHASLVPFFRVIAMLRNDCDPGVKIVCTCLMCAQFVLTCLRTAQEILRITGIVLKLIFVFAGGVVID